MMMIMMKTPQLYVPLLSSRGGGWHHLLLSNSALYPNQLNINKDFNLGLPLWVDVVALKSLYGDGHKSISVNMLMGNKDRSNKRAFTFRSWLS